MPSKKLKQFLDEHGVKYVTIRHSPAYTAQEIAASAHVKGREMAKTVMVKLGDEMAMAVAPATRQLDLERVREAADAARVEVADETEFQDLFPECEVGAMPPFGGLWGMDVYVDAALRDDDQIAFNAGTHDELIRMDYSDYERLANPHVSNLTR